jgi:hypothetical protein
MNTIAIDELFVIIGRQAVEIELLKKQLEQLQMQKTSPEEVSRKAMQQDKNDLVKLNQG